MATTQALCGYEPLNPNNDPRVPKNESDQMVATVKKNGGAVWYLIGKNEGHGFQKKANQDYQFYATIAFMQEYLLK